MDVNDASEPGDSLYDFRYYSIEVTVTGLDEELDCIDDILLALENDLCTDGEPRDAEVITGPDQKSTLVVRTVLAFGVKEKYIPSKHALDLADLVREHYEGKPCSVKVDILDKKHLALHTYVFTPEQPDGRKQDVERILCAAVYFPNMPDRVTPPDGRGKIARPLNIDCGVVLSGYRHADVIHSYVCATGEKYPQSSPQGFLTSHNRFVEREEAMVIAKACGQVHDSHQSDILFSEDLYHAKS